MGLFDDLNKNFYYTKKLTYKDVVKMLEDILAEEQKRYRKYRILQLRNKLKNKLIKK